jgi:pimeloyl-ACP methyl ester carboxylesterase
MFGPRVKSLHALDTRSIVNSYLFQPPKNAHPWKGSIDGMPAIGIDPLGKPVHRDVGDGDNQSAQYADDMSEWHQHYLSTKAEVKQAACYLYSFEYPGYGLLDKVKPSERVLYQHTGLVLDCLFARHPMCSHIVLVGHSLGAAVATYAACEMEKRNVKLTKQASKAKQQTQTHAPKYSLVTVSPFTSVNQVALENDVPKFVCTMLGVRFGNFDRFPKLKTCNACVLVHGVDDKIIPITHTLALSKQVPRNVKSRVVCVPDMGHNIPASVIAVHVNDVLCGK